MTHTLYLKARNRSAVMERTLRVTRHRGFEVTALNMKTNMQPAEAQETIRMTVTVSGERPVGTLMLQLKKLTDVLSVKTSFEEVTRLKAAGGM